MRGLESAGSPVDRPARPVRGLEIAVLVAVALIALVFRLGSIGLVDADEPRYSESAREMLDRSDLLVPHLNGEPRLNKPALIYWAIAASQAAFGVNEWASRLPSALAALATALVVHRFARRRGGPDAALLSAFVFVTSPIVVMIGRLAIPDMLLTLFETIAILSLHRVDRAPDEASRGRARLGAWTALGLAAMTKGPVGFLIPLLVVLVFLAVERRLRDARRLFSVGAILLFLAIALPWYVAIGLALGFREGFDLFVHETLYRFSSPSFHAEPWYFFAGVFVIGFVPWAGPLVAGIATRAEGEAARDRRFFLVWIAVVLVFFSLSPSKLPSYILPLAPAVALACGTALARFDSDGGRRSAARAGLAAGAALLAATAAYAGVAYGFLGSSSTVAALGLGLAGLAIVPLLAARGASLRTAAISLAAFTAVAVGAAHEFAGSAFEAVRSMKPIAPMLKSVRPEDAIVVCNVDKPGVIFYSHRFVETTDDVGVAADRLRSAPRTFVVIRRSRLAELARRLDDPPEILASSTSWAFVRRRP
jgi:4-amino-4-deoxy-L-arabinose transferase-like glycosyltransferase